MTLEPECNVNKTVGKEIQELNQRLEQLYKRVYFFIKTLKKKGVVSEAEIDLTIHEEIAENWQHLCDKCSSSFAVCSCKSGNLKFSQDIFSDLTGALADKVIECSSFIPKTEEGG